MSSSRRRNGSDCSVGTHEALLPDRFTQAWVIRTPLEGPGHSAGWSLHPVGGGSRPLLRLAGEGDQLETAPITPNICRPGHDARTRPLSADRPVVCGRHGHPMRIRRGARRAALAESSWDWPFCSAFAARSGCRRLGTLIPAQLGADRGLSFYSRIPGGRGRLLLGGTGSWPNAVVL
jgi:hypothetical protein